MNKIFCIGFHKTGTTSLGRALEMLGCRVTGPNGVDDPEISAHAAALAHELVAQYDAFQDNPWPILYRELDAGYPGSKFILTLRDSASWIESAVRHFGRTETPMRRWIYGAGCPEGNEARYVERFERHNREVLAYFESRPGDLLVMNITEGDGWEKLCPFLGFEIPEAPFPRINVARPARRRPSLLRRLGRYFFGERT